MTASDLDRALAAFVTADRVVALDFDGVLAPIVERPEDATPLPRSVAALRRLATDPEVHLALVSGRALADPALLAAAVPSTTIIGSHGAEVGVVTDDAGLVREEPRLSPEQLRTRSDLCQAATELVAGTDGAWVEQKPTAVVVHTRPVADRAAAADLEALATTRLGSLPGVRAIAGKHVVELSVAHETKGDAIERLRRDHGGAAVLYAGDDVTDEDAFAALGPGDIGIKVGPGPTRAAFRVPDAEAMTRALERLADLSERTASTM